MKSLFITLFFVFLYASANAQGLNIQASIASQQGKTPLELFKEKKKEKKAKSSKENKSTNYQDIKIKRDEE